MVFCNDVCFVIEALVYQYNPSDWHLFIDSSIISLKAVLLRKGNKLPSVPLAHATNMKESYENMKLLLEKTQYAKYEYNWNICGDLSVITVLLSLQVGYTKFCYFLCEWDSKDRKHHYIQT